MIIDYTKRTTPENITELKENEVFTYGSNLSGIHGAGAAKTAIKWGARIGTGYGISGRTYAIPTKDNDIRTMSVDRIKLYVNAFIEFTKYNTDKVFLVTAVGTGLAGIPTEDIAPLFKATIEIKNVHLPLSFWKVLEQEL